MSESLHEIPAVARQMERAQLQNRLTQLEAQLEDARTSVDGRIAEIEANRQELATQVAALQARLAEVGAKRDDVARKLTEERPEDGGDITESAGALAAERDGLVAKLTELQARHEVLEADKQAASAALEGARSDLQAKQEEMNRTQSEFNEERNQLKTQISALQRKLFSSSIEDELVTCHSLAPRCIFVIGFGRSGTTVTLELVNVAENALLLGEGNFFIQGDVNFREVYNRQHKEFGNAVSKSTYAPNFLAGKDCEWWQWLASAAQHYEFVGEKLALSSYFFDLMSPEDIRAFYEARFFEAKYIFLLRNPLDTLRSMAKHTGLTTDRLVANECIAWLSYIETWVSWIRVFPKTLTLVADSLGGEVVDQLAAFTGLNLEEGRARIDSTHQTKHAADLRFQTLEDHRMALEELFEAALTALADDKAWWQVRPFDHVLELAQKLRAEISERLAGAADE